MEDRTASHRTVLTAGLLVPLALLALPAPAAGAGLDVEAELSLPGVKLLAVEFYATWCKPCMAAVPEWKALHEKYRKHGLRFVVVSADEGKCSKPPNWAPDRTVCDPDGVIRKRFAGLAGAGDLPLPTSFLFSWEGKLSLRSHKVAPVRDAIEGYFRDTHYKMHVEPIEVYGGKYAISSNEARVRDAVITEVTRRSKLDVVVRRSGRTPRGGGATCEARFPVNSTLRIALHGSRRGERRLDLELEKDGCVKGKASRPYRGRGYVEDWASLQGAVRGAVAELLTQVARVRTPRLVGGGDGGGGDDWFQPRQLAVVNFASTPAGATVRVGNDQVCDATPCSRSLEPGLHRVEMAKTDYLTRSAQVRVQVSDKPQALSWELTPNFGWLEVVGAPPGLDVLVDGQKVGRTPLPRHRLGRGPHRVQLASRCYHPATATVTIARGTTETWRAEVKHREAGLDIRARDEQGNDLQADVSVDGHALGRAPGRFKVNVCHRKLELRAEGRAPYQKTLSLTERQVERIEAVLMSGGGGGGGADTWVRIPGGTFMMGSNEGADDEKPVHRVQVRAFDLMKTEVTVAQYAACVKAEARGCTAPNTDSTYCNWDKGRGDHPVNCVDWHQARAYCKWAGGRLPTEAEWEYAARSGGKDRRYPWGGDEAATCTRAVMDDGKTRGSAGSETDGCGEDRTWPVCSMSPGTSDQGVCDLAGNVWEWVEDCWHNSYETAGETAPADGSAWTENCSDANRVVRGGGWNNPARSLRAADRYGYPPRYRDLDVGFRCARAVHP